MIDQVGRDRLARALRHLVSGRITNDEFERRRPPRSADRGVSEIALQAWFLYDDVREHRLTGRDRLSLEDRAVVARMVVFLYSGHEYRWPRHPLSNVVGAALNLLSLGLLSAVVTRRWKQAGNFEVWPFLATREFDFARSRPRLLSGSPPNYRLHRSPRSGV